MMKMLFAIILMLLPVTGHSASPVTEDDSKKTTSGVSTAPKNQTKTAFGTISGQIHFGDGVVMKRGVVSLFNKKLGPSPDLVTSQRVPGKVIKIDPQSGKFGTKLSPGEYYIGTMKREKNRLPGPPKSDEQVYFLYDDNGIILSFEVKNGENTDIGLRKGEKKRGVGNLKESLSISGRILYPDKKPFEGAVVVLKHDINSQRPAYVSSVTGKNGKYQFYVKAGTYFFVARKEVTMSGRPRPGSYLGTYGQDKELGADDRQGQANSVPVNGEIGEEIKDIDITMYKIPSPEQKRKEMEEAANAQKIDPKVSTAAAEKGSKEEVVSDLNKLFSDVGSFKGKESLITSKDGKFNWWADYGFKMDNGILTIIYLENLATSTALKTNKISEYNGSYVFSLSNVEKKDITKVKGHFQLTVRCRENSQCISQEQEITRVFGKDDEAVKNLEKESNQLSSLKLYLPSAEKLEAVQEGLKKLLD